MHLRPQPVGKDKLENAAYAGAWEESVQLEVIMEEGVIKVRSLPKETRAREGEMGPIPS